MDIYFKIIFHSSNLLHVEHHWSHLFLIKLLDGHDLFMCGGKIPMHGLVRLSSMRMRLSVATFGVFIHTGFNDRFC